MKIVVEAYSEDLATRSTQKTKAIIEFLMNYIDEDIMNR